MPPAPQDPESPAPRASTRGSLPLGTFPTPVHALEALSTPRVLVYVKRDDRSGEAYGGNKVRKLEPVLFDARARGKTRLLTVGAAGSHHVLATATYGLAAGFAVAAVLVPQPGNLHVVTNLRASLGRGLEPICARGFHEVPLQVLAHMTPQTAFVSLGGSSVTGTLGYVDAAFELRAQIEAGALPEPDVIVTALGSGGTVAGLAVGLEAAGLASRVVAVAVSSPVFVLEGLMARLVRRTARRAAVDAAGALARVRVEGGFLGAGYGHATPQGELATARAAEVGLALDPTYTAKAFAAALAEIARLEAAGEPRTVLYWHTLSSAPMAPLLATAPVSLEGELRDLVR